MRYLMLPVLFIFISYCSPCQIQRKYSEKDMKDLQDIAWKWQRAWNSHNTDSFAVLLAPDIDYITKSGIWYKGKEAVVQHDKSNQATIFKASTLTIDSVDIKYVKPDLAIVHVGWGISGDTHHDGTASDPRHGLYSLTMIKESNKWLILHFVNVDIVTPK